jgi:hypothetical protein
MKRNGFIAVLVALLALILVVTPVMAQTATNVNGIEIFAGIKFGQVRYGATFVALVSPTPGLPGGGEIRASVNYTPNDPVVTGGTNTIVGGSWRQNIFDHTKFLGYIGGTIKKSGGTVIWLTGADINTAQITAELDVKEYSQGFSQYGGKSLNFSGLLSHRTFPPTITGSLAP